MTEQMEQKKRTQIKILHIVGQMNMGGQETFIMNVYRKIDREKFKFDFVVNSQDRGHYDDEIELLGGKIYRITPMSKNLLKHMIELRKILINNKYDVIHRHTCTAVVILDLLVAKICKVKKRIVHSHSNNISSNYLINSICKPFLNYFLNIRIACSIDAAKWLFGKKYKETIIINNGIDLEKYKYSDEKRNQIRKELEIDNSTIVIGHVGSFSTAKNHEFIVDVFKSYLEKNDNAILVLCGDGNLKREIESKVEFLKIKNKVKFLGVKENISEIYSIFDIFIFPSIYEGLGIVLIEAQISGLKCIVSSNIPNESIITENVKKLSINCNKDIWVEELINFKKNDRKINLNSENIKKFSIIRTVKELQEIYETGEK